jgi:hypothetical protein
LASIITVPGPVIVKTLPETVPVPVLDASIEKTTGFPDAPPVATSGIRRPATNGSGEGGWVKSIVCAVSAAATAVQTHAVIARPTGIFQRKRDLLGDGSFNSERDRS